MEEQSTGAGGHLRVEVQGKVAVLTLNRTEKRNALDDATVRQIERFFRDPPSDVRVAVLRGDGKHFCAGLDLNALQLTTAEDGLFHSRMWHRAMEAMQRGRVPVVASLHGGVIGGGLELASAAHVRVADRSTFYALPEGQHGLFLGGGGTVRLPRLIGEATVTDMLLTGRVLSADEGLTAGMATYLVDEGEGYATAMALAQKIAEVAPITLYAVMQALPRISESDPDSGYLLESLMAAVASSSEDAQARMRDFLEGKKRPIQSTSSG